jgi:hypothetical protein
VGDLGEGQAGALLGHESVGGGAYELVAQRPQEASMVHREGWEGDRLLGGVLGRGHYREETDSRRLETLPLGGAAIPTTMSPIDGSSKSYFCELRLLGILGNSP